MIFGAVPLAEAEGAVLAHSMKASSARVPKGTVLAATHLQDLAAAGHETLVVARLEPNDVDENTAAQRVAHALVPQPLQQGLRISGAGAGRVNLYATGPGIVDISGDKVAALNSVDPMITLATVPHWHRVEADTMVATIKIISYAVPQEAVDKVCRVGCAALHVIPPALSLVSLIETQVGSDTPSPKGRAAMVGRMDRLGLQMSSRVVVLHDTTAIAKAITEAPGEIVFILTASATSDPRDVAPDALRAAGGQVEAYGMPVDPGNLLFFGDVNGRPVIGLPGCARSPALNGADWVLERLICGVPLTQTDISAMGVGGLLKEIPTRPRPRDG